MQIHAPNACMGYLLELAAFSGSTQSNLTVRSEREAEVDIYLRFQKITTEVDRLPVD